MKRIEFQIVVDCHGERVEQRHMYYLLNLVKCIRGEDRSEPNFWITRTDLMHDFFARTGFVDRPKLADEPRHEPSFDLYVDGGIVPVGRLINVAVPEDPYKAQDDMHERAWAERCKS